MLVAAEMNPIDNRTCADVTSGRRLLVVDRHKAFARFARLVARGLGYETSALSDARALADRVRAWRPGILVMEIVLPELDGIEIIRLLSELGFDGQLILVTAHDPRYLELARKTAEARGLRVAACLAQPARTADLIRALESCAAAEICMHPAL